MAGSPAYKVYKGRTYKAACKEAEAAAALAAFYGHGATIRYDHWLVLWTEGADGEAAESYDAVTSLCYQRLADYREGLAK